MLQIFPLYSRNTFETSQLVWINELALYIVLLTVRSVERDVFPLFVRSESYTLSSSTSVERDSRISIQSKTSAGMWRRRPISRKASRPAFLEAWSLRRLVIEIYSAKQSSSNVQHRRRETLVRETHSNRVRGDSSLGASNSIGACGVRIVPLEHFVVLVLVVVIVV